MASLEDEQPKGESESTTPPPPTTTTTSATANNKEESVIHRTKTVQFLGRSTPIILQNDNGPCPLLAICNVLLLKKQLNLSPDISEVSEEKLLSLVAERLIDSNSNVNDKAAGYVENQQQNIADAIDLLPRLGTGIDVNIKFRRIDDFEFTPECAIFDLLDIPLYHGWLVDPQDHETAEAIGSKSYNTLMSDLVALETRKLEAKKLEDVGKVKLDEDSIDFAAATTAALGVPSPNLSRAKSFDESPRSPSSLPVLRKGDAEEEAELSRVLKLSENESAAIEDTFGASAAPGGDVMSPSDENLYMTKSAAENSVHVSEVSSCTESLDVKLSTLGIGVPGNCVRNLSSSEGHASSSEMTESGERHLDQSTAVHSGDGSLSNDVVRCTDDAVIQCKPMPSLSLARDTVHDQEVDNLSTPVADSIDGLCKPNGEENSNVVADHANSESSSGRMPSIEAIDSFTSSLDDSEPIYEGEECILDSGVTVCDDREPVYEGEMVLAEQADKGIGEVCDSSPKGEISLRQGELINNFLKNAASQLTFYGLFCLQEGLNERELCVFFRNNHFSTMFKFDNDLYLLATDQGYMNQSDLVWEKLNEVNGDTLFMTSNFKEFKLEDSTNASWNEQNAVATTTDYLASIDNSTQCGSNMHSDLQLAIALQQQEFEQQPQHNAPPQPPASGSSKLITGPQKQVPRSSGRATSSSQRQDQKSKDKSNCKIM